MISQKAVWQAHYLLSKKKRENNTLQTTIKNLQIASFSHKGFHWLNWTTKTLPEAVGSVAKANKVGSFNH